MFKKLIKRYKDTGDIIHIYILFLCMFFGLIFPLIYLIIEKLLK